MFSSSNALSSQPPPQLWEEEASQQGRRQFHVYLVIISKLPIKVSNESSNKNRFGGIVFCEKTVRWNVHSRRQHQRNNKAKAAKKTIM